MRKYLYAAVAAGATLMLAAPAAQAHTATPRTASHVLTVGKLHGTAVKVGAVLKASLAKGTTVTIAIGTTKATCKKASFSLTVVTNPVAKGKATGSVTSEAVSKCTINFSGATVNSITATNLPYNAAVSDSSGDPVTISGTSDAAPIQFTATITIGDGSITCAFDAATSTAHSSNKHHTVTFSKQKFTDAPSDPSLCSDLGTTALFSASYGPIVDSTVSHSPTVYVN